MNLSLVFMGFSTEKKEVYGRLEDQIIMMKVGHNLQLIISSMRNRQLLKQLLLKWVIRGIIC